MVRVHTFVALVAVVLALCLAVSSAPSTTRWHQLSPAYTFARYTAEFNKAYAPTELAVRKSIFEKNLAEILAHNADGSKGWKKGVNHMTDYTESELRAILGYRKEISIAREQQRLAKTTYEFSNANLDSYPTSVDWRQQGVISNVKDQGHCGSCWTFATAESIESAWALKTGQLQTLSEQQILDCTPNPEQCGGTGGCSGGTAELALENIIKNYKGGISSEWTYPYRSYQGNDFPSCGHKLIGTPYVAKITDYSVLPSNQYAPVIAALQNGPLSISVDASSWHTYESGVFTGCEVNSPDINHAVQAVGYGTDPKLGDYWIVRNSWSPAWGEDGYIRIARSSSPTCGVDVTPLDGTGCAGGPSNVTVCGECGILFDNVFPIV